MFSWKCMVRTSLPQAWHPEGYVLTGIDEIEQLANPIDVWCVKKRVKNGRIMHAFTRYPTLCRIEGSDPENKVDDLKAHTEYTGYIVGSNVVVWFWEVVKAFNKEDRARLLEFVTGTSKVPLEGFKALQGISGPQRFQIHKAYGAPERLPSTHTWGDYYSLSMKLAKVLGLASDIKQAVSHSGVPAFESSFMIT
ncbi:hypothetical protein L6452_06255 [Arctium lappa]|uniref:Uncharacterized protein n=1 Tax=Arctium lappa TaxID=4217 RepID=A0ACB9EID0_ARCLA|nr:hypothetical protein L6452_06255 [Arctium lappa]